ncbi:signal peptidase I [Halovivax sp.]|uniref:signal peptidase I n=1 Tax=Halovivax sp. TaxID=1935978 RepID=UPI0025B9A24D|nr:signal peptidase I [Halovivax sp.]
MSIGLPSRRQVCHWIGLVALVAIVVPFVIYAVPGVIGAEGSYVVMSGSMEPSIGAGDVVIVDDTDPTTIEEGDVITYVRDDAETPTTHRVIDVVEADGALAFETQGDANDQPDASAVPASQVRGEVVLTIPYIGYVITFVNTPLGFSLLVVGPLLLLLATELYPPLRARLADSTATGASEASDPTEGPIVSVPEPSSLDPPNSLDPPSSLDPPNSLDARVDERSPRARLTDGEPIETDQIASPDEDPASDSTMDEQTTPSSATEPTTRTASGGMGTATDRHTEGPAAEGSRGDDATISIYRTDLRLSLALLVGTTVYAAWVALRMPEPLPLSIAFASALAMASVGVMYYLAGDGRSPGGAGSGSSVDSGPGGSPDPVDTATDVDSARYRIPPNEAQHRHAGSTARPDLLEGADRSSSPTSSATPNGASVTDVETEPNPSSRENGIPRRTARTDPEEGTPDRASESPVDVASTDPTGGLRRGESSDPAAVSDEEDDRTNSEGDAR